MFRGTKLLATTTLLLTLLVSPLMAVDIEGTYVCKLVYHDGSSADYVYKVSSSELRTSRLGESYETKYIETYAGKNGYKFKKKPGTSIPFGTDRKLFCCY